MQIVEKPLRYNKRNQILLWRSCKALLNFEILSCWFDVDINYSSIPIEYLEKIKKELEYIHPIDNGNF